MLIISDNARLTEIAMLWEQLEDHQTLFVTWFIKFLTEPLISIYDVDELTVKNFCYENGKVLEIHNIIFYPQGEIQYDVITEVPIAIFIDKLYRLATQVEN